MYTSKCTILHENMKDRQKIHLISRNRVMGMNDRISIEISLPWFQENLVSVCRSTKKAWCRWLFAATHCENKEWYDVLQCASGRSFTWNFLFLHSFQSKCTAWGNSVYAKLEICWWYIYLVLTMENNRSLPGHLKTLYDLLYFITTIMLIS